MLTHPIIRKLWSEYNKALAGLGIGPSVINASLFKLVVYNYQEFGRQYHNLTHVYGIFNLLNCIHTEIDPSLSLAVLYHDVVYFSSDAEKDSAEWAKGDLKTIGINKETIEEVEGLILSTKKHKAETEKQEYLINTDLTVLGEERPEYVYYARAIEDEYLYYQDKEHNRHSDKYRKEDVRMFNNARIIFLEKILSRERIYTLDYFFVFLEEKARNNLNWELSQRRRGCQI